MVLTRRRGKSDHVRALALQGQRASKGIFITTSNFSNDALDYARGVSPKIVLIDGEKLADLMIEHYVSVSKVTSYGCQETGFRLLCRELRLHVDARAPNTAEQSSRRSWLAIST